MHMSSLAGIDEWRAMDFSRLNPFEIALAATLFVCLTRGVTIPALRALLLSCCCTWRFNTTGMPSSPRRSQP